MTSSSVHRAEMPGLSDDVPGAPAVDEDLGAVVEGRAERRHARNRRRLLALGGLAIMGAALCATVAVLDVVH